MLELHERDLFDAPQSRRSQLHVWKELNVPDTGFSINRFVCVVWMAIVGAVAATPVQASVPVGINMAPVYYFNTEWFFVDAMKSSSRWFPQQVSGGPWDTGANLTLTADGWPILAPGQAAATVMFVDIQGHYPGGNYICLYEGQGTIEFGGDAHLVSQTPGRMVVNVQPSNTGIVLRITSTPNPSNPIRNVRMIMPGFEATYLSQPFHPTFLARLQNYKVLRFMDWQRTNGTTQVNWSQRVLPSYRTQALEGGVSIEHMIKLCNTLGADPWFCIPHTATDDYVRQFARLVRDTLNPALKVYIEHSNEVWNGGFQQAAYAQQQGLQMGLASDPYLAGVRYHSLRSVQIFNIWNQEFGAQQNRIVRVLGAQHDNPWIGRQIMDFQNAWQKADAIAVAPYFGYGLGLPNQANNTAAMTIDQILDAARADMLGNRRNLTLEGVHDAQTRGLKYIAYEGGQHLVGVGSAMSNATLNNKFWQANRHPRMGDLYTEDLNTWSAAGGDLFVEYSSAGRYTEWGSWGTFEWQNQPVNTAPKYSAIQNFISSTGTAPPKLVQLTGNMADERFGFNVASAGDINNDGKPDILVSGPRASVGAPAGGHVMVYSGTNSALLFYKVGHGAGDQFGYSAVGAGDVNGDGFGDIIIGAFGNDEAGTDAGKVFVYSGKTQTLLYSITGSTPGERFGFSVAKLGDVNGDGRSDFAVGGWGANGAAGRVRVYSGSTGNVLYTINGLSAGERLGYSVAGVGDVTGDNVPDLVVGAPWGRNPANVQTGRAYVFNGANGALVQTRYGESNGAKFGRTVAHVGDVNGDGRNDYGVGAFNSNANGYQSGKAYIFSGTGPTLFTQAGAAAQHRFGLAISGIGDINFDGRADFAIGSHRAGGSGRVYVYTGGSSTPVAIYRGDYMGDKFGHNISSFGDRNGDGRPDFLVGAWGCSSGGFHAGRAYVISGAITSQSESIPLGEYSDDQYWLSVIMPSVPVDQAPGVDTGSGGNALASAGSPISAGGQFAGGANEAQGGIAGMGEESASSSVAVAATYVTAPASELDGVALSLLTSRAAQVGLDAIEQLDAESGATLRNSAFVSPFDAGGELAVQGDYIQTHRGVLAVHIGASGHERLAIEGTAKLGGALVLTVDESAQLAVGDAFEIVSAGAVAGSFSTVFTPVTAAGLTLQVEVQEDRVIARVVPVSDLAGAVDLATWIELQNAADESQDTLAGAHIGALPQWFKRAVAISGS